MPLNQPTDTIPDDKVRNYQIFPDLSGNEEAVLRTSIKKVGVLIPIVKDDWGNVVEGHQRKRIAGELGVPCPEVVRHFGSEQEKFQFALISNRARRRNLNQQQKRHTIADYLVGDPEISNNWLAEILGVSDATVIEVRKELESTSQIGKLTKLRGKDGKRHPATKKENTAQKKKAKTKLKVAKIEPEEDEPYDEDEPDDGDADGDEDDEHEPDPATDEEKREEANLFLCLFGTDSEAWAYDTYTGPEPEAIPKAIAFLIENFFPGGWAAAREWMATTKVGGKPVAAEVGGKPVAAEGEGEPVAAEADGGVAAAVDHEPVAADVDDGVAADVDGGVAADVDGEPVAAEVEGGVAAETGREPVGGVDREPVGGDVDGGVAADVDGEPVAAEVEGQPVAADVDGGVAASAIADGQTKARAQDTFDKMFVEV